MSVESLIEKATSERLLTPDWSANMELCDKTNTDSECCGEMASVLLKKIRESSNPKVVQLSLTAVEALVKNGSNQFHQHVAARNFINEIAALTEKKELPEVSDQALQLIQQWGMAFAGQRLGPLASFHDVYMQLKMKGVEFPNVSTEMAPPVFTPPPSSQNNVSQIEKLRKDLQTVSVKLNQCRQLCAQNPRQNDGATIQDVLDFLTQCQPRMNALIEAGIAGRLDESTFEECLKINDNLVKVLDGDMSVEEQIESKKKCEDSDMITFVDDQFPVDMLSDPIPSMKKVSLNDSKPPPAPANCTNTNDDEEFEDFFSMRSNKQR